MLKNGNSQKVRKEGYVGAKKFWAWESREISDAAFMFLMGYVIFYCTDVLQVDPVIVGTLFAVSKIIDGITDILAGFIVDRTNTRWGRGRPYDICLIGAWGSVVALFMFPSGFSEGAKVAWVVGWYVLANSVFYTFLNAGEGVFFTRTFNRSQAVKMTAQGSIATSLLGLLCGIIVPQMINSAGKDPAAWAALAVKISVVLCAVGLCRMLFVREENKTVEIMEEKEKTELRGIIQMLRKNRFWMVFCLITLITNVVSNMGVGVYFFEKVLGNLALQSIFAAASSLAVVSLVLLPALMKRFQLRQILMAGQLLSVVFNMIMFIFYKNLPVLVVGYTLNMFVSLPATYVGRLLLMDCAVYNEYLGLNRMEGSMYSIDGFNKRAGSALGTFLLGVSLKVIRYDAAAPTVSAFTEFGLRFLMFGLPVFTGLLIAFLWSRYTLEKIMPGIKEELKAKKAASAEVASVQ